MLSNTIIVSTTDISEVFSLNQILHVKQIEKIYTIEQGCTCPIKAVLDSGKKCIIKYPNNNMGIIVLINEYISYRIAKLVNLTTPDFYIACIDENTKIIDGLNPAKYKGIVFGCDYIESFKISNQVAKHVSNLNETCRMVALDEVVKNRDRHPPNILVNFHGTAAKMYFIDYSHAFGDPEWRIPDLSLSDIESPEVWDENKECYEILLKAGATFTHESFKEESLLFQEKITEEKLDLIINDIPKEWLESSRKQNLFHAKKYILNRVKNLDKIWEVISRRRSN